jgi:magnesium transporter
MLMDTGGNAGAQASTLVIRSIVLGEIEFKDTLKVIWKEIRISLVLGIILASVNFLRLVFLEHQAIPVSLTVSITLLLTVIIAKVIGGSLPLFAKKLKLDPAIMASPLITTIVDTVTLAIYFYLAVLFLGISP